jgi:uncharacterized protein YggU (UPF0235/DUF167 family)
MEIGSSEAGTLVTAHVRTRSRRGLEVAGGRLIIRVNAAPVQGKATEEARRVLASALDVSLAAVALHSGERSRTKVFVVRGVEPDEVRVRLTSGFEGR